MWIPKTITNNSSSSAPFTANILFSENNKINVSGLENVDSVEVCRPYGVACVPPTGSKAVVLPVGSSAVVCGVVGDNKISLEQGEVALYSKGGASILLKNDGAVVINGTVFEKENE